MVKEAEDLQNWRCWSSSRKCLTATSQEERPDLLTEILVEAMRVDSRERVNREGRAKKKGRILLWL